jgi:hypothetical protein
MVMMNHFFGYSARTGLPLRGIYPRIKPGGNRISPGKINKTRENFHFLRIKQDGGIYPVE